MTNLTPIYHKVKDTLEDSCLVVNERYIGIAAFVLYRVLPKNIAAIFIDGPGVPPTGPDTSGDVTKPEGSIIPQPGKSAEDWSPSADGTRNIVIDVHPHNCTNCKKIILPGEKFNTTIRLIDPNGNKLPKAEYEAEHVICPKN